MRRRGSPRCRWIAKNFVAAGACALLALSCESLRPPPDVRSTAPGAPASWDHVLEGRGSQASNPPSETGVVGSSQHRVVESLDAPAHEVQSDGGRMYILELYQQTIEEKEGLIQHVRVLETEREELRKMLAQAEERIRALVAEVEGSIASEAELRARVDDLAGRLLTAQIRRLEAEKILLQAKLETPRESDIDLAAEARPSKRP